MFQLYNSKPEPVFGGNLFPIKKPVSNRLVKNRFFLKKPVTSKYSTRDALQRYSLYHGKIFPNGIKPCLET